MEGRRLSYREKMLQANREAKAAVVGLALTTVVWIVLGFGLSGCDAELFGTPVWVVGGTVGTWIFAIAVSVVLGCRVFKDFDLDEEESDE